MSRRRSGLTVAEVRRLCAGLRKLLGDRADAPAAFEAETGRPWDPEQWDRIQLASLMGQAGRDLHLMISLAAKAKLAAELDRLVADFEDRHDLRPALRPVLLDPPASRAEKKKEKRGTG